ncbi:MAG: RNA polymerase sigma factor [Chitinophagales bacterium]
MNQTEYIYLQYITQNDRTGLQKIYSLFLPRIAKFIVANGGNVHDAKDVFQDAIVIIYQKARKDDFKLTSKFSTLLYGVCRNLWGNRLQKVSRRRVTFLEEDKYKDVVADLDNVMEKEEKSKLLWMAFKQLGAECQKLMQLFFGKKKMVEIVEVMGYSSLAYGKKRKYVCKERLVKRIKESEEYRLMIEN